MKLYRKIGVVFHTNKPHCLHPDEKVQLETEGGMRFYGGDVYDTYSEKLVCLECGAEVEPVKQYVPKFEYVGF